MNEFEKACNTENYTGETSQENVIEWVRGDNEVTVTLVNGSRYKSKVLKLAAAHPEVKVVHTNKDGSIVAHLPLKCIKISWPKEMSEEQREKSREIMQRNRENNLL